MFQPFRIEIPAAPPDGMLNGNRNSFIDTPAKKDPKTNVRIFKEHVPVLQMIDSLYSSRHRNANV